MSEDNIIVQPIIPQISVTSPGPQGAPGTFMSTLKLLLVRFGLSITISEASLLP
jgi:hypothetical protein